MSAQTLPYLNFTNNGTQALSFYQSIFGGELTLVTFSQMGALPDDHPAAHLLMHGVLHGANIHLYASDVPEGVAPHSLVRGNDMHVALMSDNIEETHSWFTALSEGGTVEMPFQKQIWGAAFGSVTDQFGTRWLVNATPSEG